MGLDRRVRTILVIATAIATLVACVPASAAGDARSSARRQVTGAVVVSFTEHVGDAAALATLESAGVPRERVRLLGHGLARVRPAQGESPARAARRLSRLRGVRAAASEGRVRALGAVVPPNDPTWGGIGTQATYFAAISTATAPHSVDLEPAWQQAFNGAAYGMNPYRGGVTLAVVDSGASMPWLESTGEIVGVWNYIGRNTDTTDDNGHGTEVSSILRAKTSNGWGIAGVLHASRNTVLVYKVLDASGSGVTADTVAAIMDAADKGAKVISCSLGEPLYEGGVEVPGLRAIWTQAVDYAAGKGSLVVAATGNDGSDIYAPAAIPSALAIGSISPVTGLRSGFSNFGPEIDLCAPGEDVYALTPLGSIVRGDGTSFATPIVAGSLALLWSLVPDTPATQMVSFASATASDYPPSAPDGFDQFYGNGKLDVWAAYQQMMATIPTQAPVSLTAGAPSGTLVSLSWSAAQGSNVTYAYGAPGGPEYRTSATSAQLALPSDGANTVYVKAFCTDRWSSATPATTIVAASTGLGALTCSRFEGDTRYATAAAASRGRYPGTASAVVVCSGQNWPDALGASVLAAASGGPLLLTTPGTLSLEARDEIVRLSPSRIYVVGGSSAVSNATLAQIDSIRDADVVARVSGADRYGTAASVADEVKAVSGSIPNGIAYVASGENYPDALAGAAIAAASGRPILLARRTAVPPVTRSAITRLGISDAVVLGGTNAISAAAYASLPSPERVAGADRYATSRAIADHGVARGIVTLARTAVATGRNYPDALAAGACMGPVDGPLVLVPSYVDSGLRAWLNARGASVTDVSVFGGPVAIPYGLENSVRAALRGARS